MIVPKKKWGQHFLIDDHIAEQIVGALQNTQNLRVVEVGAGTGCLTQRLMTQFQNFVAYDIDKEAIGFLKKKYKTYEEKFVAQDFLNCQIEDPMVMIGNFPYNISSPLFFKILENRQHVLEVVCMLQKEVGERICAQSGSRTYGLLSVLIQAFYTTEVLFTVAPTKFYPIPKVQSVVIRLQRNNTDALDCDERLFKNVVKMAFNQRRKILWNALKNLDLPKEAQSSLPVFQKRAEQMDIADFVKLTNHIAQWKQ